MSELAAVPRRYLTLPPPDPRAPGPFAFADRAYFTDILTHAGFADVTFAAYRGEQLFGGPGATLQAAADFVIAALPIGDLLKEQPESIQQRALEDLRAILKKYETPEGVKLKAMAWLVSATAR
jgi:hypothetical protein